ncbi:hypothetical protein Tco_1091677 [Tanacetum coccineum]|uniref:Uncharacterized protein n=1 Tax=Tanacetum coccineum TaxID=301880 RepID=A0ABQ5I7Q4_9ASTR
MGYLAPIMERGFLSSNSKLKKSNEVLQADSTKSGLAARVKNSNKVSVPLNDSIGKTGGNDGNKAANRDTTCEAGKCEPSASMTRPVASLARTGVTQHVVKDVVVIDNPVPAANDVASLKVNP